jgi:hypothetical protein
MVFPSKRVGGCQNQPFMLRYAPLRVQCSLSALRHGAEGSYRGKKEVTGCEVMRWSSLFIPT